MGSSLAGFENVDSQTKKKVSILMNTKSTETKGGITRRKFIAGAMAAATFTIIKPEQVRGSAANSKIVLGAVGQGGRGNWITKLFAQHGGYQIASVADYFPQVALAKGKELGVAEARCFSGLSGYKKLIASGVDAVLLEVPPYFFAEQAQAAVAAGKHVYMAKPVASDVPGTLTIDAAAREAERKKQVFLVDYQIPTDPFNLEVAKRVRAGGLGKLAYLQTIGISGVFDDPPIGATIENRLQKLIWVNDIVMGCDYIGNFDIHAIDAAVWLLGQRPLSAVGHSRIIRPNPHGDSHDVIGLVYDFEDGTLLNHRGQAIKNNADDDGLCCKVYGDKAMAQINYWGKAFVRGGAMHYGGGAVENLYESGAKRNIAAFHEKVMKGDCHNQDTVKHAIDSVLTCILGREAAERGIKLTMAELIKENKKLPVNLEGLKD